MKIGDRVEVISTPEEFYPSVITGEKGCITEFAVCSTVIELESGFRFDVINKDFDKYLKILPSEIDLSVNQIIEPMVDAWFRDKDEDGWVPNELSSIDNRMTFPYRSKIGAPWKQCTLTDPNKEDKEDKEDNEFMSYKEVIRFIKVNNVDVYFQSMSFITNILSGTFKLEPEEYTWQEFDSKTYKPIGAKKQFLKKYLKGLDCE